MLQYDVFNGDADGICALHQLRLDDPADTTLITDVKQKVRLVERFQPPKGSRVTVLDISFKENLEAVERLLKDGTTVRYFDHHFAGDIPEHPLFECHINTAPDVCTSLLVNRHLEGRQLAWAVVGAYGDNLEEVAKKAAGPLALSEAGLKSLQELGDLLNYNGYGTELSHLHFHPVDMYRAVRPYTDPVAFLEESPEAEVLRKAFQADFDKAARHHPMLNASTGKVYLFPDESWAWRIMGIFANRIANENPTQATAIGVEKEDGALRISVRAPLTRPKGADELCRRFPTGGGRAGAAAVNRLPLNQLPVFLEAFQNIFSDE